jgi:hypothetical protein
VYVLSSKCFEKKRPLNNLKLKNFGRLHPEKFRISEKSTRKLPKEQKDSIKTLSKTTFADHPLFLKIQ